MVARAEITVLGLLITSAGKSKMGKTFRWWLSCNNKVSLYMGRVQSLETATLLTGL